MGEPAIQNGDAGQRGGHATMADYRDTARKKLLPKGYSGYVHLGWLFGVCTLIMTVCISLLEPVTWRDAFTVPLFLVLGNMYEYYIHRFPGHSVSSFWPFRYFFKSHTGLHHRFYTYSNMQPDHGHHDYYFTLFPLKVYATWYVTSTLPVVLLGQFVLPWNTCLIASSVASFYLVLYEVLHSYAHRSLPPAVLDIVSYIPGAEYVRRHHSLHHHARLMTSQNFNLTFPLTDWLVGTWVTSLPRSVSAN